MDEPRNAVRSLLLAAAALAAVACASSQSFEGPGGDRRFYEARCGVCHVPWTRESRPLAEWPRVLDDMAPRAGLTSPQRERVLRYLTAR